MSAARRDGDVGRVFNRLAAWRARVAEIGARAARRRAVWPVTVYVCRPREAICPFASGAHASEGVAYYA